MKLKDLISVVQCNTYIELFSHDAKIELFSRDAKFITIFTSSDLELVESELIPYLDSNVYMISAYANVLQVCII